MTRAYSTRPRIFSDDSPVASPAISLYFTAGTSMWMSMRSSSGTRIHRRHQHEIRWERHRAGGARDHDAALFERFAQRFQHIPMKLRQFVEKQHAVVGQTDFAGRQIR